VDKPRDPKFLKDRGITDWGTFNDPPKPMVEVDMQKFWHKFSSYGIAKDEEYRQLHFDGKCHHGHILIYHDVIFFLEVEYSKSIFTPHLWIIGCIHECTSVSVGRCLTEYTCKKCGFKEVIDSSD
jgi:hypothetical protein